MTTGTRISDGRYFVTFTPPFPNTGQLYKVKVGPYRSKSWNGTDSVSKKKQVTARVPREGFPSPPDVSNRLPNESTRQFRKRIASLKKAHRSAVLSWRQRNPKGQNRPKPKKRVMPPNPYTVEIESFNSTWWFVKDGDNWWTAQMWPDPTYNSHIPLPEKMDYAVIEKLRRKLYGSGFHPGITGAESLKSLKTIGDASRQIRLGLISLVNGNWRGIIRNLGEPTSSLYGRARYSYLAFHEGRMSLSKAWLAFYYGWRPLLKDLDDASAYLAEMLYGADASLSRSVIARKKNVSSTVVPYNGLQAWFRRKTTTHYLQYKITDVKVAPSSQPPSVASLAAVAWEVVPYSFVCDWVAPIASYLQACRTAGQVTGSSIVRSLMMVTVYDQPTTGGKPGYPCDGNIADKYEKVTLVRTVTSELNPPSPMGDLSPGSIFSVWERSVSAVALLQNLRFPELDRAGFKKLLGRKT